jgi:hypothetical protein
MQPTDVDNQLRNHEICLDHVNDTLSSPLSSNTKAVRRSSFLAPLGAEIKIGGISKRRSSCAFALAPFVASSPDHSLEDSCLLPPPSAQKVLVNCELTESPAPDMKSLASPSPCVSLASASRRKTLASLSPSVAHVAKTPRRQSLIFKSPILTCFEKTASSNISEELSNKQALCSHDVGSSESLALPIEARPIEDVNRENIEPNASKKTPEKKKRRLYNPARIPDALLEE